jgi:diguanylate cyclase (GGDEF)-like protein/PAS domain S-box-containing protein
MPRPFRLHTSSDAPDSISSPDLKALRVSESRYRRLFETARDGILLLNADTAQIEDVNPYLIELLGYSHDEFLGKKLWELGTFTDIPESREMFSQLQSRGFVRYADLPLRTRAGKPIAVEFVSNSYSCDGVKVIQCNIRNITERKLLEEQVRQLAFYDELTLLPNRRLLNDRLSQVLAACKRGKCFGALMFLDLDNFKSLNDAHGHEVGDQLLVEVARRLKETVRAVDTVARFGGDEFVVVLGQLGADEDRSNSMACSVAEKIRATLAAPYRLTIKGRGAPDFVVQHHSSASIGIVAFDDPEMCKAVILQRADAAMYQAKESGRNSIRLCQATEQL